MSQNSDEPRNPASCEPRSGTRCLVGKAGFEPAASASRTLRANQAALLPGQGPAFQPGGDASREGQGTPTGHERRKPLALVSPLAFYGMSPATLAELSGSASHRLAPWAGRPRLWRPAACPSRQRAAPSPRT